MTTCDRCAELEKSNKRMADGLANACEDATACRAILEAATHAESVEDALKATEGWQRMSEVQQDAAYVRVAIARLRAQRNDEWNAALEAAATRAGEELHAGHDKATQRILEQVVADIRALKRPA